MRYFLTAIIVFFLSGCVAAPQTQQPKPPDRQQLLDASRDNCKQFGYKEGTPEMTKCTEEEFVRARKMMLDALLKESEIRSNAASQPTRQNSAAPVTIIQEPQNVDCVRMMGFASCTAR